MHLFQRAAEVFIWMFRSSFHLCLANTLPKINKQKYRQFYDGQFMALRDYISLFSTLRNSSLWKGKCYWKPGAWL